MITRPSIIRSSVEELLMDYQVGKNCTFVVAEIQLQAALVVKVEIRELEVSLNMASIQHKPNTLR